MSSSARFTESLSTRVQPETRDRIEQIARRKKMSVTATMREAFRHYIDHQEDVIGSKRHFTQTMKRIQTTHHREQLYVSLLNLIASCQILAQLRHQAGEAVTVNEVLDEYLDISDDNIRNLFDILQERATDAFKTND